MTDSQRDFLCKAKNEAIKANHPFPVMAACEAALESNWGKSQLARAGSNLFGMKQHKHVEFPSITLPTQEYIDGKWQTWHSEFVQYPDWASCFADRLATLKRLSSSYMHYSNALDAQTDEEFVTEVSQTWSTDPNRAAKCISIFKDYMADIEAQKNG